MNMFQSQECADFFEHWKSLRANGALTPSQEEFLNNPHPTFSSHLYITEANGGDMVFQYISPELTKDFGRDRTGEVLGQNQPANFRVAMNMNSRMAISTPCGILGTVVFKTLHGASVEIEALALPLSITDGKPSRLVTYSHARQTLAAGDVLQTYTQFPATEWVDIGAGAPGMQPLSDGN